MILQSDLPPKEYLDALMGARGMHYAGIDRIRGWKLGPVFSISKTAKIDGFNTRRHFFTSNAFGFVRKCDGGCRIYALRTLGSIVPSAPVFDFVLWFVVGSVLSFFDRDFLNFRQRLFVTVLLTGAAFIARFVGALKEFFYEESEVNSKELTALLADPANSTYYRDNIHSEE